MNNLKPIKQSNTVVSKSTANLSPETLMIAGKGVEVLGQVITAIKEYSIAKELEKTERDRIQATLELGLKRMQNERENFQDMLKIKHEERMEMYKYLNEAMKIAVEKGDLEIFQSILKAMKDFYSDNPELTLTQGKHHE